MQDRDPDFTSGLSKMGYVHILKDKFDKLYIGSTKNLNDRIGHHEGGYTHSTKHFKEVKIVFSQEYPSLSDARRIESWLKKLKRRDYVEQIIKDGYIKHTLR